MFMWKQQQLEMVQHTYSWARNLSTFSLLNKTISSRNLMYDLCLHHVLILLWPILFLKHPPLVWLSHCHLHWNNNFFRVELPVGIGLRVLGGLEFSWIHSWQDPNFLQLATGIPRDQQNNCWSSGGPDLQQLSSCLTLLLINLWGIFIYRWSMVYWIESGADLKRRSCWFSL